MMKRARHSARLEDVVSGIIHRWGKRNLEKGNAVRAAWMNAAGEKAAGHTQPASFKKGQLVVLVENSSWLYKMAMEKTTIVKKFNESYEGRAKVKDIRFRIGKIEA